MRKLIILSAMICLVSTAALAAVYKVSSNKKLGRAVSLSQVGVDLPELSNTCGNPCAKNPCGCHSVCTALLAGEGGFSGYTCRCWNGYSSENGKNCF